MNKQQIIDRAMQLAAGVGHDPLTSPVIDADMTAEDLLPLAFRQAYRQLIHGGDISFQDVMRSHIISCIQAGGLSPKLTGPVPAGVLNEFLESSFLPEFPFSSYLRYLPDYNRDKFSTMLCYYTVNDGIFYTTCGFIPTPHETPSAAGETRVYMGNDTQVLIIDQITGGDLGITDIVIENDAYPVPPYTYIESPIDGVSLVSSGPAWDAFHFVYITADWASDPIVAPPTRRIAIVLDAASIPDLAIGADVDIVMPARAEDTVIAILASAIRGEVQLNL